MKRTISEDQVVPAVAGESRPAGAGGGEGSMLGELVRAVLKRPLEAELTAHLGHEKGACGAGRNARNRDINEGENSPPSHPSKSLLGPNYRQTSIRTGRASHIRQDLRA